MCYSFTCTVSVIPSATLLLRPAVFIASVSKPGCNAFAVIHLNTLCTSFGLRFLPQNIPTQSLIGSYCCICTGSYKIMQIIQIMMNYQDDWFHTPLDTTWHSVTLILQVHMSLESLFHINQNAKQLNNTGAFIHRFTTVGKLVLIYMVKQWENVCAVWWMDSSQTTIEKIWSVPILRQRFIWHKKEG